MEGASPLFTGSCALISFQPKPTLFQHFWISFVTLELGQMELERLFIWQYLLRM
jgi:hypothetical protein